LRIPQIPIFNFGGQQNTQTSSDYQIKEDISRGNQQYSTNNVNNVDSVDLSGQVSGNKKPGTFSEIYRQITGDVTSTGATTTPVATSLVYRTTPSPTKTPSPTATPSPTKIPIATPSPTKIPIKTPKPRVAVPTPASNSSIYKPKNLAEAKQIYGERANMKLTQIGDNYYYVVDTPLEVTELSAYWLANGMHQHAGFFPSGCDYTARYAAYDLMWGIKSSKNDMKKGMIHPGAGEGPYKTIIDHSFNSRREAEEFLYNQLKAGYATTIAIEHPTRDGDNRHVITGVGMDPSVKSFDDFDLSKVLSLDNADGRLKTLTGKKLVYREGGYHIGAPSKSWLNLLKAKGKL
jgi:hypothetical protein